MQAEHRAQCQQYHRRLFESPKEETTNEFDRKWRMSLVCIAAEYDEKYINFRTK